ncbi:MAG: hypothetical protein GY796_26235 [Chloroflexi bacterium]|nr:hypothetical protein [Chloroflexota bacterium]
MDKRIFAGYAWLVESIQATGKQGSSKGFSYLGGWMKAYPETTGYIIPTFLRIHVETGDDAALKLSVLLAEWLQGQQREDGGIPGISSDNQSVSQVFDTGMVLQGYTALYKTTGDDEVFHSAKKCADFLIGCQSDDGAWRKNSYHNIPHAYHARVAWPLMEFAKVANEKRYSSAAKASFDWILAQQRENGYWENNIFNPKIQFANTHGLGYVIESLIEAYLLEKDENWLDSARKASLPLMAYFNRKRTLPAFFNANWKEARIVPFSFVCLTGAVQLAYAWLKMYAILDDRIYLDTAIDVIDYVVQYQDIDTNIQAVRGALPGSTPLYGYYLPFKFPNWATKFLLDALLERRQIYQ